ncbi:MAG: S16 family serine protease, partial [Ignavibacteriaceae bacterium]|nr:S16 family serine protease [Ignavibacteriaceae bacterium]
VIGEVGLGGEVRSVGFIDKRIHEAEKLGFRRIIIPQNNMKGLKITSSIEVIPVENISEAIRLVLR